MNTTLFIAQKGGTTFVQLQNLASSLLQKGCAANTLGTTRRPVVFGPLRTPWTSEGRFLFPLLKPHESRLVDKWRMMNIH